MATIDSMFLPDTKSYPPGADVVSGLPALHDFTVRYLEAGLTEFREETSDVYGNVATAVAVLPIFYGELVPTANVARLVIVILSCVIVFQGKLWGRWVLVLFVGLIGLVAVLNAFAPSLSWAWRLAFAVLGFRNIWELHFLFRSAVAKMYFESLSSPTSTAGGV